MLFLGGITNEPKQRHTIILPNGNPLVMTLEFKPQQLGWFATFSYVQNEFTLANIRVTTSPNMLHQYSNLIPFGIAVITDDNREPQFPDDFQSGATKMYLMDVAEVQEFEDFLNGVI